MKAFLDANILVSVLNKEYPTFTYSARILSLADSPKFSLYTSSLCLAIGFYFASKKSGSQLARRKIAVLKEKIKLAVISEEAVTLALKNKEVNDLEDGFQYYAALEEGCSCIITENLSDYYFSQIEVVNSHSFLKKYIF